MTDDQAQTGPEQPPEDMLKKALKEGPLPGLGDQEKADAEIEATADTAIGKSPEDEGDELTRFTLRG